MWIYGIRGPDNELVSLFILVYYPLLVRCTQIQALQDLTETENMWRVYCIAVEIH